MRSEGLCEVALRTPGGRRAKGEDAERVSGEENTIVVCYCLFVCLFEVFLGAEDSELFVWLRPSVVNRSVDLCWLVFPSKKD